MTGAEVNGQSFIYPETSGCVVGYLQAFLRIDLLILIMKVTASFEMSRNERV